VSDLASLDTNVLLRATLNEDAALAERARQLIEGGSGRFLVSDLAIAEYVFALERHYGFTRDQAAELTAGLLENPHIVANGEVLAQALERYRTAPKLSFADCYLAAAAADQGAAPLWTFDKKLARQHPAAREVPAVR
jgi:predicted nucleic acid-binding protein